MKATFFLPPIYRKTPNSLLDRFIAQVESRWDYAWETQMKSGKKWNQEDEKKDTFFFYI